MELNYDSSSAIGLFLLLLISFLADMMEKNFIQIWTCGLKNYEYIFFYNCMIDMIDYK